jgi:outer membrane protein W
LGLNASYIVIPHFALELAWNRFETDIEAGRFKLSEITIMPLLLTAQFRILPSNPVVPYVGVGVGYYFNKLDKNREVKTETETSKTIVAEEVDDSLGLHVDGGVDWFLTDNFALNLDARYFWTEADITGKENLSSITDEIDLDSLVLGFGVKLYF